MIQYNLQEISANCKENVNFIVQVIKNGLKQKMSVKTWIQQKYAIYDLKSQCTHRETNKLKLGDKHKMFVEQWTWK